MVAGVLNIVGLLGIGLSKTMGTESPDIFLYALTLQAIGGSLTMFCGYTVPFLFPDRATLLIETNSCLFDASTIIFPIFKIIYDAGAGFSGIFDTYAVVAAVSFTMLVIGWSFSIKDLFEIKERAGEAPVVGNTDLLSAKPFGAQLRTLEFAAIMIFSTIQIPRSNIYMGTVDLVNANIAKHSGQEKYLDTIGTIIGLVIPFGFLSVPAIELCVHKGGIMFTMYLTCVIGWVYMLLQFIPELFTQLVTVVIFAAWRAFLFSIISAYSADIFGPASMGRVMGLSFLFSGLANFSQAPLIAWTLNSQGGDFTYTLLMILLVSVPLPLLFVAVQYKQKKTGLGRRPSSQHRAWQLGADDARHDARHGGRRARASRLGGRHRALEVGKAGSHVIRASRRSWPISREENRESQLSSRSSARSSSSPLGARSCLASGGLG